MNLAWKLADVLHGRASAALLDSYEPERGAFAQRLVATTDRAFVVITSRGRLARFIRRYVTPRAFPLLTRLERVRRLMFRTISQTTVHYHASALSAGRAGRVTGGDRLPWISLGTDDNFRPLESLTWQAHVYGTATPELTKACEQRGVPLRVFVWRPAMRRAGLARNALYLVRPDGYVALADRAANPGALTAYLDARGLRFG
jgi:hypothetical protein